MSSFTMNDWMKMSTQKAMKLALFSQSCVKSLYMVVTNLECMALSVTHLAPQTVSTTCVIYRMGHVMVVNLDGWELGAL